MIERLDPAIADEEGWIPTPHSAAEGFSTPLAGLAGIPFQGVLAKGNSTFTLQNSYTYLDCQKPAEVTTLPPHLAFPLNDLKLTNNLFATMAVNMSEQDWRSGRSKDRSQAKGRRQVGFASILRGSRGNGTTYIYAACTCTQTYIEARVFCKSNKCGVTDVRSSLLDHEPSELTHLDGSSSRSALFYEYFSVATDTQASSENKRFTITQRYISDAENSRPLVWPYDLEGRIFPNILSLTAETFSTRFTTTYNTFYTTFSALTNMYGMAVNLSAMVSPPADTPVQIITEITNPQLNVGWKYRPGVLAKGDGSPFFAQRSKAEFIESEPRYVVHRAWILTFIVSVCVLIIVSLVGFFFQVHRVAPDFLATMAGMVRDSEFIAVGDKDGGRGGAASVLEGAEAVRRFGGLEVVVADVKPEGEVGRVALVGVEEAGKEGWGKVRLGRLYE